MNNGKVTKEYCFKPALLAGCVVLAMFFCVLVIARITPFGDNTFLMYDMKRQYVDYYSYLKSIFAGNNNLLYSFSTTLGAGMVGFEVYYLSSPFLLILVLFPQAYIPLGVTFIIGIKLALAAVIMSLFIQRTFGPEHKLIAAFGAISWSFSSFLFAHSMNMMWMDVIILFPLIIWALEELLERCNRIFYIIVLALMLWFNYYITFQVIIFLFFWGLFYIFITKPKNPVKGILRTVYCSALAVGIDAVALLPTGLELFNSPKDIRQLGLTLTGNNLIFRDIFSKLPTCAYDYIEARFGLPQIFCGVLLIILSVLFYMDQKTSIKERIATAIMFAILLVSFCNDAINLIWHAGMEPSGHPYRYAYMWIFLMIICSCKVLVNRKSITLPKVGIAILLVGIMFYEVLRTRYDHISDMTIMLNWTLLIIYGIGLGLYVLAQKKQYGKLSMIIICAFAVLQTADLGVNAVYTYHWQSVNNNSAKEYSATVDSVSATIDQIKRMDSGFYRMENLNPRQQNDGMQYDYKGITHYSSAGMTYVRYFLRDLGFNDDGLYTHYGHDNTVTADSIFGIKYLVSDGTYPVHPSYSKIIDDKVSAYQNPYALSCAIGVNDLDVNILDDEDPFDYQQRIYSSMAGEKINIFDKADFTQNGMVIDNVPYMYYYVEPAGDGELYMYLDDLNNIEQGLVVYLNDELVTGYGNASSYKVLNLGYHQKGEELCVCVEADTPAPEFGEAIFVTENLSEVERGYNIISARCEEIEEVSSSHLKLQTYNNEGVFLSVPYEKGWNVMVNGVPEEPRMVYGALMYIPLDNTSDVQKINMYFLPDGLLTGMVISLFSIICFVFIVLKKVRSDKVLKENDQTAD